MQVLLTERFDESLMVMRHILGWHMIDMFHVYLNQTAVLKKKGEVLLDTEQLLTASRPT